MGNGNIKRIVLISSQASKLFQLLGLEAIANLICTLGMKSNADFNPHKLHRSHPMQFV
jgi:hypothetical protein